MQEAARRGRGRPRVKEPTLTPEQEEMSRIRQVMGLTQEAFAEVIGVSADTVYRWESGRRNVTVTALKLARFLLATRP